MKPVTTGYVLGPVVAVLSVVSVGAQAPGQPTITSVAVVGSVLNINWTPGAGPTPDSHRLDFYVGASLVTSVSVGAVTSASLPIPPGTQGAFAVRVTPFAGASAGPASAPFPFTIGGAGCTGPPAAPVVTGSLIAGIASLNWPAVPGASSYIVSAGTTQGGTNLLALTDLGTMTTIGASGLPAGFTAWVRVVAANACGQSAPTDFFLAGIDAAFLEFTTAANACGCWFGTITLQIDGATVGSMTCTESRLFPVTPGPHAVRACDFLGCITNSPTISNGSVWIVELFCTASGSSALKVPF